MINQDVVNSELLTFGYDTLNQFDLANGNATTQKTDALGRLLSVQPAGYPANPGVSYTYDALDRLTTATYGSATTTITYDWAGRKTYMSDPDMGAWTYQYDGLGNLVAQTDAEDQTIWMEYDSLNRLLEKWTYTEDVPPVANTLSTYSYDQSSETNLGIGWRTGMEDASGSTTWTYDERGRLSTETKNITGAGTFLTKWTYYANDAVKEMTYPGGNNGQAGEVVTYEYNSQALLKSMHSSEMNYVPEIVYDAAGRVDEMTLGEGLNNGVLSPILQKDYSYYAWNTQSGRMQSSSVQSLISNINLQALTYTYDPNGNITQMIDARQSGSEALNYVYDNLNRLKTVTGAYEETAQYDTNGRITERQMPDASKPVLFSDNFSTKNTTTWNWSSYATAPYIPPDSHDSNPVAKSLGNTNVEPTGLKRTTAIATQTTVQLRFKLSQVGTNAQFYFGLPPETTEPPCNPGELCEMSVPNDALEMEGISGGFGLTPIPPLTTYHNQAGLVEQNGTFYYFRMEGIHGQISSTPLLTNVQANEWYTLTLHRGGTALSGPLSITVTQENDSSKTGTATQTVSDIDWHFRHTIQAGIAYLDDYKEISEDDSNIYLYGSKPHAVTSITQGGQTIRQYTYDLNGNMTQRIEGSDTYIFGYDQENRLISGVKNSVTLASYSYDGDGRRVKAVENGVTTIYIGDYYEWRSDSTTTTQVKYYYAGGTRVAERVDSTLTWLLGDHLGSTAITATENGTLATEQTYTAWGQTRSGAVTTDRQYTGQISEAQLGIYFYNARYYDPLLGRFISSDTIVPDPYNPLDWDRYQYVRSNPINNTDPSGRRPCSDDPNFSECEKGLPHAPKNNQDDPVRLDTYYPAADIRSLYIKYKYTKGWWNDDGYGSAYFTELDFLELMLSYEFSPLPTSAAFAEEYPGVLEDLSHGTSHWYNSRCELLSGGACSGVSPNGIFNFLAASQSMRGRMNAIFSGKASVGAVTQYGASNTTVAHAVVADLVNPPNPEWRRGGASIKTAIGKTEPYTWGNRSMLPGDPLNPIWQYGLSGQDIFYILPVEVKY